MIRRFDATGLLYELRLVRSNHSAALFPAAEIKRFRRVGNSPQAVDSASAR
jgi:hypothetical protein